MQFNVMPRTFIVTAICKLDKITKKNKPNIIKTIIKKLWNTLKQIICVVGRHLKKVYTY